MAALIDRYVDVVPSSRGNAFETLARAIVGQQISVKAADAVWARVVAASGSVDPTGLAALGSTGLTQCGVSARKAGYLLDLADGFRDGRLQPTHWPAFDDDAVIADLVRIRGIGRWTAQMFLIFNLQRPDIWPIADIGLQKAVAMHYLDGIRPSAIQLETLGERFAPWRSVATWFLWRSLDPVVVQY